MELPQYLTHELVRRIAGDRIPRTELETLFQRVGIDIDAEGLPPPNLDELAKRIRFEFAFDETLDDDDIVIRTGVIYQQAELTLLGETQQLTLRLSYAAAPDHDLHATDWHLLVWNSDKPAPRWVKFDAAILDPAVIDAATMRIELDLFREPEPGEVWSMPSARPGKMT